MLKKKFLNIIFYITLMLTMILFLTLFNPSIGGDEVFSMGLIHHGFSSMIHLSYFDVHPPLYYLTLKIFLLLTTFWTKSILVKIMFAKILSVIFFIILFQTLYSLLKNLGLHINLKIQLFLYLIVFPVVTFATQIRMYEMVATFIAIELLYVIKFCYNNKNLYLFIAVIFAVMASYTHYFAAMFAGSLLLIYTIRSFKKHDWSIFKKFLSGIILFIIAFIPCLHFAIRQFSYEFIYISSKHATNMPETQNFIANFNRHLYVQVLSALSGINFHSLPAFILGIVIDGTLIYLTIHFWSLISKKLRSLLSSLIGTFIISLIIPIILSFMGHPIIIGRYYYPLISIYEFILVGIIISQCNLKKNIHKSMYYTFIIILLSFSAGTLFKAKNQLGMVDLSSIQNYKQASLILRTNKSVHLSNKDNLTLDSVYMEGKKLRYKPTINENKSDVVNTLGANNQKLLSGVFNNINIHFHN